MRIIGCDLHASQQSIAMLDQETGETAELTLKHEGDTVRDFFAALPLDIAIRFARGNAVDVFCPGRRRQRGDSRRESPLG